MLKKLLKKVGAAVVTVSIFILLGCSSIDQNQAEEMESLLQKKYGEEFVVTHIGGRWGTATNDTVTVFAHPKDDRDVVFEAVMTKDGKLAADGYIPGLMSQAINRILKQELLIKGIESESHTFMMNANSSSETNSNISLEEYVKKYKPGYFSGDMIIKEGANIKPEIFETALRAVYKAGLNTMYQVTIYAISKDDYDGCMKEYTKVPDVSEAWFIDYNVVDKIELIMDSKGFQVFKASKSGFNKGG